MSEELELTEEELELCFGIGKRPPLKNQEHGYEI